MFPYKITLMEDVSIFYNLQFQSVSGSDAADIKK